MHIAFIMDGNGRWALRNGLTRAQGHEKGITAANEIMKACVAKKIARATFYAFSVQNWNRDRSEIESIYTAGKALFETMGSWVNNHNVVVKCVGTKFNSNNSNSNNNQEENPKVQAALTLAKQLTEQTASNTGTVITLCVSYGSREEILEVFQQIQVPLQTLTTTMVSDFFQIPDVDLVVRTSGEYRVSNFLLWQSAYAEYYFTDLMWPEFTPEELDKALASFYKRDRRFGAIGGPKAIPQTEDLKSLYQELLVSFPTDLHAEQDLTVLYGRLAQTYSFQKGSTSSRKVLQTATLGSQGAMTLLLDLYDLEESKQAMAYSLLAKSFTIETLDHIFQKPYRLYYIDMTKEEKQLLQRVCELQSSVGNSWINRICANYCVLKIALKQLIHEDALTLYAVLLTLCGDILDRRFQEPQFYQEDLKTLAFQLVRETLDMEKHTQRQVLDFLTFSWLAPLFHYFEEPNMTLPPNFLDFLAHIVSGLKELVADRFIGDHE
jgi:undecaprenyl diphosphate synthase